MLIMKEFIKPTPIMRSVFIFLLFLMSSISFLLCKGTGEEGEPLPTASPEEEKIEDPEVIADRERREFITQESVVLQKDRATLLTPGQYAIAEVFLAVPSEYVWESYVENEQIIFLNRVETFDFNNPGEGDGMIRKLFKFRARQPGETTITLKYFKPWEGEESAQKVYSYTVKIR